VVAPLRLAGFVLADEKKSLNYVLNKLL